MKLKQMKYVFMAILTVFACFFDQLSLYQDQFAKRDPFTVDLFIVGFLAVLLFYFYRKRDTHSLHWLQKITAPLLVMKQRLLLTSARRMATARSPLVTQARQTAVTLIHQIITAQQTGIARTRQEKKVPQTEHWQSPRARTAQPMAIMRKQLWKTRQQTAIMPKPSPQEVPQAAMVHWHQVIKAQRAGRQLTRRAHSQQRTGTAHMPQPTTVQQMAIWRSLPVSEARQLVIMLRA